jgi:hypothetical protein
MIVPVGLLDTSFDTLGGDCDRFVIGGVLRVVDDLEAVIRRDLATL